MRVHSLFLKVCISIFLVVFCVDTFGQEPLPAILNASDFLNDPSQIGGVWDIDVDSNGRVVMVGNAGVRVFDGESIELVKVPYTPNHNMHTAIFKDFSDRLWIRGYYGEWRKYGQDSLVPYAHEKVIQPIASRVLESAWQDSLEQWHLAPRGRGYYIIDKDGNEIHVLGRASGLHGYCVKLLADGTPFHFSISNKDSLKKGAGFNLYFIDASDCIKLLAKTTSTPSYESTLLQHDDGSFTLSMGNEDILHFTDDSLINYHRLEFKAMKLFEDSRKDIWIGSTVGLFLAENGDLSNMTPILKNDAAAVVAEDKTGGLWIKSGTLPFAYIRDPAILAYDDRSNQLNLSRLDAIASDGDKIYCLGEQGITTIHKDSLTSFDFPSWNHIKPLLPNETSPYLIEYDSIADLLWIVYSDRIASWNGKVWNPILIRDDRHAGSSIAGVKSVCADTQIVVAGQDVFTIAKGKLFSTVRHRRNGVSPGASSFIIDTAKVVWVASNRGLWNYIRDTLIRPIKGRDEIQSQASRHVLSAYGKIWVNYTNKGLFYVHQDNLAPVLDRYGQPIFAYAMTTGPDGSLWIYASKNNGLLYNITEEGEEFQVNHFDDPFLEYTMSNDRSPILVTDEYIFAATINGLLGYPLKKLQRKRRPSSPVIDKVLVNYQLQNPSNKYKLLPKQNSLVVEYGMVSFNRFPVLYRTRLLGLDSNWLVSERKAIQFTNLDPGEYTFQVQSRSGDEAWSQSTEKIFVIASPFHKQWWFKLFVALGLMAIGFGIYWIWSRVRETQNALEIRRIRAEQRALRAQLNPHFIFNSLSSVQYYLSKKLHREAEDYIQRFATVMRIILENSEQTHVPLSAELQLIRDYVELESARFDNSNIELTVFSPNLSIDEVLIPPLIFQPYIENSIVHGLRFKQGKKEIRIHIEKKDTLLQIIIEDNGIGRRASAEINGIRIAKRSLGMSIAEQRITALSKNLKRRITVKDLVDAAGNACGTQITFFIPYESTNS